MVNITKPENENTNSVIVLNSTGQSVYQTEIKETTSKNINLSFLLGGIYSIKVSSSVRNFGQRIVLLKK